LELHDLLKFNRAKSPCKASSNKNYVLIKYGVEQSPKNWRIGKSLVEFRVVVFNLVLPIQKSIVRLTVPDKGIAIML
jgi:hypothetical protein